MPRNRSSHRGARETGRGDHGPRVVVLEILSINEDGEPVGKPVDWRGDGEAPEVAVREQRGRGRRASAGAPPGGALGPGDRALVRLHGTRGRYEASVIKRIAPAPRTVIGIYDGANRIQSTQRAGIADYWVHAADTKDAEKGEMVVAQILERRRLERPRARVIERLGVETGTKSFSMIAVNNNNVPHLFEPDVLADAAAAGPVTTEGRVDLRDVPLVTIDGEDARDFDDAVWAEPVELDGHAGWHIIVAIADVAWYVRPGSALDREALRRGNSTYFPDRVVPMLPEALSNGWCSLRPNEDRACMAAHIWIDAAGNIKRHRFERAIMCSVERLTYNQVQHARDHGSPDLAPLISPLYGAFGALLSARERRQTIDLDVPERYVRLDSAGRVVDGVARERLDSHRLIEEFMIAANVAAAETLERLKQTCMYRIHDAPPESKLVDFAEFARGMGLRFSKGQVVQPSLFIGILAHAREKGIEDVVSELVLRAQSQAEYSVANIGHFGLALRRYCHFTSPIRRYPDLIIHRLTRWALEQGQSRPARGHAKVKELLKEDELRAVGIESSEAERRADDAERELIDLKKLDFMEQHLGDEFDGLLISLNKWGFWVELMDLFVEGVVALETLDPAADYYFREPTRSIAPGRRSRVPDAPAFHLGDRLRVRVDRIDRQQKRLHFSVVTPPRP